jgi:hypothetical protein
MNIDKLQEKTEKIFAFVAYILSASLILGVLFKALIG